MKHMTEVLSPQPDDVPSVAPPANLFLIGPMGSGKTAVGRVLARLRGQRFIDADAEIERRTGVDIPFIFEQEGEAGFREREQAVIDDLTQWQGIVLATGGGVILNAGNRELLRQRAEAEGLYFEPLGLGDAPTHAVLWVAREDAIKPNPEFAGKFLDISNPFGDDRIRNWTGVSVKRTVNGTERELIPLALYGLDYPKVPLLLVDFRATHSPKRREMISHAFTDVMMGVIGYSRWGNWPYMGGSYLWNFTRTRRGAASNRQARLNSYASVRRWLALDHSLPETLRADLQKQIGRAHV